MDAKQQLDITYRPIESLVAYAKNARVHSKAQIQKLAHSMRAFGFTNPILIDGKGTIIAGHGRLEAAKLLGLVQVPTIALASLTEAQVRAYVIADNRLAEDASWNEDILRIELQSLVLDTTVEITSTGFEVAEIDVILTQDPSESDPADELPEDLAELTTKTGDLWLLGDHRILCGDSLAEASFATLMVEQRAAAVFADPPYNVVIDGHASGNGKTRHTEFAMASGEMTPAQFTEFLARALGQLAKWSLDGSIHFICMDWRHMSELLAAGTQAYAMLLNLCVWAKDNGGMGSFYRSKHELIFVFKVGTAPHRNNIQLGKFGRYRTNVWSYPGANTFSRAGSEGDLLKMHPTVKPVALIVDAILDCTARKDIVLDSFLGSGSTLLAAERVGRVCYGLEIEPKYVDLAIRRWQQYTGDHAVHAATGMSFNELVGTEARLV